MFSPSRYQSILYPKFKAATSAPRSPISAMFLALIWVRPHPITRSLSPEIFAPAPLPRQKCVMRGCHVGRAQLSSKAVPNYHIRGKRMAIIPMIPVGPVTTRNRSIFLTERRMSGTGGDAFICGHCGHVMLEDFDPSSVRGNPVYQCGVCENNNDLPFAATDARHWPSR
jgi:hypothetical protein